MAGHAKHLFNVDADAEVTIPLQLFIQLLDESTRSTTLAEIAAKSKYSISPEEVLSVLGREDLIPKTKDGDE